MSEASLAILNANVITLDSARPWARAIAVRDDRILAVGSEAEIRRFISSKTEIIDAKGRTVVPGLVDCHVHMTDFGFSLQSLDLRDVRSIKELQRKLKEYASEHPEEVWILRGRWDQEKFKEKRLPTRWDLDAAVADRPVLLVRVCGHIGVANTKALRLAGITGETVVEGGKVDLDETTGQPTGVVQENALGLIFKAIPKPGPKELEKACLHACEKAAEAGLTGVHWMVSHVEEIEALKRLDTEGKLPLRVHLGIDVDFFEEIKNSGLLEGLGDGMTKMGFVKILADGSLGAHSAALTESYSDEPRARGMLLYSQKILENLVLKAHEAGFQLAIHAIGDRAVEAVLKAYEKALKAFPKVDHRHRIEHCSVLNPKLIEWMKRSRVIASVQPHFVVSDFWTIDRIGKERSRWVYPFKTLYDRGLVLVSGSDCPVEKINPMLGIWAAVTRKDSAERLTVEEVLRTYTLNAAYASFDEDQKGTIEAGKFADLTVLSADPFKIEPDGIKKVKVEMTIVGGQAVYQESANATAVTRSPRL